MNDRFHLAASMSGPPTRTGLERIARSLGLTEYDTRLRLKSSIPRTIAFRDSCEALVTIAGQIHDCGLTLVIYNEARLPAAPPFPAFRMGRTPDGFIFEDRQGDRRTLAFANLAFVVIGRRMTTTSQSDYELKMGAYGADGSRMAVRLQQVTRRQKSASIFITFLERDSDDPPVRIVSESFDFQCLGRRMGQSDNVSAKRLIAMVGAQLGDVPTDTRMLESQVGETMVPHNRAQSPDVEHAASILFYWEYLANRRRDRLYNAVAADAS